ncbi:MAG: hypothetical protein ABIA04_00560 [Pseudomonadota bacterium]
MGKIIHGFVVKAITAQPSNAIINPYKKAFFIPKLSAIKPTNSMKNALEAIKSPKTVPATGSERRAVLS